MAPLWWPRRLLRSALAAAALARGADVEVCNEAASEHRGLERRDYTVVAASGVAELGVVFLTTNASTVVQVVKPGSWAAQQGIRPSHTLRLLDGAPPPSKRSPEEVLLTDADMRARPLALTLSRWTLSDADAAAVALESLGAKAGYISGGGDIGGNKQGWHHLSLLEAWSLCRDTPACQGIVRQPIPNEGQVNVSRVWRTHLKDKFDFHAQDGWLTIPLNVDQWKDIDFGPEEVIDVEWVPPNLDALRGRPDVTFLSEDPPIVQIDGFLTDAEVSELVRVGQDRGLEPSTVGGTTYELHSSTRSSSTAWLDRPQDWRNAVLAEVDRRIEELTNVPRANMEHAQLLRYEVGERYTQHHDLIEAHMRKPCGPRLGTFYMYLSDVVSGGGTRFPKLGITVTPQKGRAVLWWSFNFTQLAEGEDVYKMHADPRTYHESLPVLEGVKWGVNKWLHHRNFVTHHKHGRI